jgi:PRTRC genetic system ThiF family protein
MSPYRLRKIKESGDIMVVGCGGTGAFVAEGVCRLIRGTRHSLRLVDPDRVEERNLGRQLFYPADLGRFKAEALALRLAGAYGVTVEYSACRIEKLPLSTRGYLTIGCVDNPGARERLQWAGTGGGFIGQKISYHRSGGSPAGGCWYIDAGNGEHSGQVLIGNALLKELGHSFVAGDGLCHMLPLPTIQQPGLLAPETRRVPGLDCARAVAAQEQSPVINQAMAALVIEYVHKLLTGSLTWMGSYIDLEAGTRSNVDADPAVVSRLTGHSVPALEYRPRKPKSRAEG